MTKQPIRRPADCSETLLQQEPARVIALLARRPGDNAQAEVLAAACGLPWRPIRLGLRKGLEALPNLRRRGSLFSYDAGTQAALWACAPDVVIAVGKRSAPAALWLKAATGARLVHIGRTWAPAEWFDHVITTAQYRQPRRDNVVENVFPLTVPHDEAMLQDSPDIGALPRPRLFAIAGGSAAPLVFGAAEARTFMTAALERRKNDGGSLLVATSPRTSPQAVAAIREALGAAGQHWRLTVFGEGPNEYRAFLAAADRLLVTNDSVSMVAEAAATGRPVDLFALPSTRNVLARVSALHVRSRLLSVMEKRFVDLGLIASGRDLDRYMAGVAASGLLDGGSAARDRMASELEAAAAVVRRLVKAG